MKTSFFSGRRIEFIILTALFSLFVLLLYGPTITIGLLSFQGPNGGLTFPMNGWSLTWFRSLLEAQAVGDFAGAFKRSFSLALLVMQWLGVSAAVNHGATMVILESFNALKVLAALDSERCTAVYGVPTMFLAELEHPLFKRFDLSHMRTGIMAGSVCPEPLMRRVVDDMNMTEITICYGLTEASPVMTQSDIHDPLSLRCETVGCAMPGIEVRVGDPDTCEELPRGEVGEILCRGYNVMKGYYNMPDDTAKAISPEGWLHSGDLGVMDENGYLRVTGRIKDMIIRGGENIYPREVEEFLLGMPGILDVQVVAVPSRKYGEEVAAFIIPRPGVEILPEDVRDFCRGKVSWYKIPKYIKTITGFPLTASGKIQKFKLREMAAEFWPEPMQR